MHLRLYTKLVTAACSRADTMTRHVCMFFSQMGTWWGPKNPTFWRHCAGILFASMRVLQYIPHHMDLHYWLQSMWYYPVETVITLYFQLCFGWIKFELVLPLWTHHCFLFYYSFTPIFGGGKICFWFIVFVVRFKYVWLFASWFIISGTSLVIFKGWSPFGYFCSGFNVVFNTTFSIIYFFLTFSLADSMSFSIPLSA